MGVHQPGQWTRPCAGQMSHIVCHSSYVIPPNEGTRLEQGQHLQQPGSRSSRCGPWSHLRTQAPYCHFSDRLRYLHFSELKSSATFPTATFLVSKVGNPIVKIHILLPHPSPPTMNLFSFWTEGNAAGKHFNSPELAFRQKERYAPSDLMLRARQGLSQAQGVLRLSPSEWSFAFRKHLCMQGQVRFPRWDRSHHPRPRAPGGGQALCSPYSELPSTTATALQSARDQPHPRDEKTEAPGGEGAARGFGRPAVEPGLRVPPSTAHGSSHHAESAQPRAGDRWLGC